MVAPIRESANKLHPTISKTQNNLQELSKQYAMDIKTDLPRGCSVSLSPNSSREVSVISAGSSMDYAECIQAQANKMSWAEQVKSGEVQSPSLSYAPLKEMMPDTTSMGPAVEPMHIPHAMEIDCENVSQGLEPLVIPYQADQPVDPNLWDGNFCPISLFSVDNYLEGDTKNVTCSLLRMVTFIKQCQLKNRTTKDILQIVEFGFTV